MILRFNFSIILSFFLISDKAAFSSHSQEASKSAYSFFDVFLKIVESWGNDSIEAAGAGAEAVASAATSSGGWAFLFFWLLESLFCL